MEQPHRHDNVHPAYGTELIFTKREVLKIAANFLDPTGNLAQVIIQALLTQQHPCHFQLAWDDVLPNNMHEE